MKKFFAVTSLVVFCLTGTLVFSESAVEKGKEAFEMNACTGCHIIGQDKKGPDLTNVTKAWAKEKMVDYIMYPEKYLNDPRIKELTKKYNQEMPNQEVEKEDAELIYEYLKSLDK